MPRLNGVAEDWERQLEWYGKVAAIVGATIGAALPGGVGKTIISVGKWTGTGAVLGSAVGYGIESMNRNFLIDLYARDKVRRDTVEI